MPSSVYFPDPPRTWSRLEGCPSYTGVTEAERKVAILQYPQQRTTTTRVQQYAEMARGRTRRFRRTQFATQTDTFTDPTPTLRLPTCGNAVLCAPASASGVPGQAWLCWDASMQLVVPTTRRTMSTADVRVAQSTQSARLPPSPIAVTIDPSLSILVWNMPPSCLPIVGYRVYAMIPTPQLLGETTDLFYPVALVAGQQWTVRAVAAGNIESLPSSP